VDFTAAPLKAPPFARVNAEGQRQNFDALRAEDVGGPVLSTAA
jgi:hypothetical protein